ncbi:MAG TPA: hypothetical protein VNT99_08280 [Methylomirabilota bacterium]|nr:hypothetical protein [Methylomirabilota bacterium]
MATFKFFNIGKANEEISRLETENARITADALTSTQNSAAVEERATQLSHDLATATQSIGSLSAQVTTLNQSVTDITADRDALAAKLANPSAQIVALAAVKAGEVAAAQGIPPIAIAVVPDPTAVAKASVTNLSGLEKAIAAHKLATQKQP